MKHTFITEYYDPRVYPPLDPREWPEGKKEYCAAGQGAESKAYTTLHQLQSVCIPVFPDEFRGFIDALGDANGSESFYWNSSVILLSINLKLRISIRRNTAILKRKHLSSSIRFIRSVCITMTFSRLICFTTQWIIVAILT